MVCPVLPDPRFTGGIKMHSKELFSEYEANVRSYSRSFPEIFTKAKGAKMYDENGKE